MNRLRNVALAALLLVLPFVAGALLLGEPPAHAQVSSNVRSVASIVSAAAPGANTDILAADYTATTRCAMRVTVSVATGSVFNVVAEQGPSGATTTYTFDLNGGTALTASTLYTFTFSATPTATASVGGVLTMVPVDYNFRVETDGVIQLLLVEEVYGNEL